MATADIGVRLREARLERGLSLRGLAQSLGVSASLLSQVETGKTQPSVSTLYAIVNALGISLDDLLGVTGPAARGPARPPAIAAVQRADENPILEMENGVRWERLAIGRDGTADALLVTYAPGASSSVEGRLMRHAGVEYAYILEGRLTLQLDFDEYELGPGDSLHFDSVQPHLYSNRGSDVARGVWFVVGRRQQNLDLPRAPGAALVAEGAPLTSAVDVLRALDGL